MSKKSLVYAVLVCFAAASLAGCSGAQKKRDEELKGVKTKVDTLESKVEGIESKQSETERALAAKEAELAAAQQQQPSSNISVRSHVGISVREIQAALKNAGFYEGRVDGVKGKMTRKAIREFQKANGLHSDGVVGKKTWELLSKYSSDSSSSGDVK